MSSNPITSDAHINAAKEVIAALVSEYETLEGRMAVPAQGRRALAMERLCAVTFRTVSEDLDPYGMGDLDEQLAHAALEWSLFITDLMVGGMLDFRQKAEEYHHRPENYRDRLQDLLLNIWLTALQDLQADPEADQDRGNAEDQGVADDAGKRGGLAA